MMRLAHPSAVGVAIAAVIFIGIWILRRRRQRYPFPLVSLPVSRRRRRFPATTLAGILAAGALIPLAVALSRPQEVLSKNIESAKGVDLAVVLDVSGSMAALDFQPTDRLNVAKKTIAHFLDQRPHDRIALVVFAGAAVTLCPLTLDHDVAKQLLDSVKIGALPDGTAIGMGLGTAVNRLRNSTAKSKVIVLVTDGANNAGQLDPLMAADLAKEEHMTVHTVLVGKGGEVPMPVHYRDPITGREMVQIRQVEVETNPELLAEISRKTGGLSFLARDPKALADVFSRIDSLEKTEFKSTRLVKYRERFEGWALAALSLLLTALALEVILGGTPW